MGWAAPLPLLKASTHGRTIKVTEARAKASEEGNKGSAMEGSLNCLALPGSIRRTPQLFDSKNHGQDPRQGRRPFALWRPWLSNPQKAAKEAKKQESPAYSEGYKEQLTSFRHPVRLFWPKSSSFDYLYAEGEKLLENFPVQATISFYEDSEESDSDREEDEEGEDKEQSSFLQKQGYPH